MGIERTPPPGRLIMGVLWGRREDLDCAEDRLSGLFGPVRFRSDEVPFSRYTNYYEKEMGRGLNRCLWAFEAPFPKGTLVEAKLATNRVERALVRSGLRTVNLDPGLLTLEGVSLATTKPYYHRIYLSKGIYGELTLVYRVGRFEPLPWTYPDYQEGWALEFFHRVRGELLEEHRGRGLRDRTWSEDEDIQ